MLEPKNNFPIGFYREFLEEIKKLKIEVITYDDIFSKCDDYDHESFFVKEFKLWKKRRNPKTKYLLIQHDVDNCPHLTVDVVNLEREYGIKSNVFMFATRWTNNDHPAHYPIDHRFFQEAEKDGFVIGYHQNAFQLAGFNVQKALQRFESDVEELRKFYKIDFVVPHGGQGKEISGEMRYNKDLDIPKSLQSNIRWVYNKYGLRFSRRVSDGGLRKCTDKNRIKQLDLINTFLPSIRPGERAFILTHPQRWGTNVSPSETPLLSKAAWYQDMCNRYPKTIKNATFPTTSPDV